MGKKIDIRVIDPGEFVQCKTWEEKIKFILRYGILAPSTHNSQPWLFRIKGEKLSILKDPHIQITKGDPTGRDLFISFGCLIETIAIAARAFGLAVDIRYSNDIKEELVAEMEFRVDVTDSREWELLQQIPQRVNARGVFDRKAIPQGVTKALRAESLSDVRFDFIETPQKIEEMARLTRSGLEEAYKDPGFRAEISRWMHSSFSSSPEGMPGYSLRLPALLSLVFPWLLRTFNIGKRVGHLNYLGIRSVPLIVVWSAEEEGPEEWIKIGRSAERLMLRAFALGLKTSIFVASVEIGELHKRVRELIECPGRPQFVLCIGYMNNVQKPNLRHPVSQKIVS
jgi:hypothetical protein